MSEADAALRNCLQIEQIQDYMLPVQAVMRRVSKEALVQIYKVPMFNDASELLRLIAQKRGRIRQGGILDTEEAAKVLIMDWNSGRIPYYTIPPDLDEGVHLDAQVVTSWSAAFNLDAVMELEKRMVMANLKTDDALAFATVLPSSGPLKPAAHFANLGNSKSDVEMDDADDDSDDDSDDNDDDGDEMEEGDEEEEEEEDVMEVEKKSKKGETAVAKVRTKKHEIEERPAKRRRSGDEEVVQLPQVNLDAKKHLKDEKKSQRKDENFLKSIQQEQPKAAEDAYDFGVDFWKGEPPVFKTKSKYDEDIDLPDV
jgi:nuclear GTP-binding protein